MITGISGFGFFVQKWPSRDAKLFCKKWVAETPIFIVFFGCALFLAKLSKREILDTHQKKKKLTDNWKALFFSVFLCFFVFFLCFFCYCFSPFSFFFFVLEGLRVRWGEVARRATPLGPKPSLLIFCCFFCFLFCCFFLVFCFGGFKGQVRWPKGPPHLALNPPYLFVVLSFFSFPFFASNRKPCFFP